MNERSHANPHVQLQSSLLIGPKFLRQPFKLLANCDRDTNLIEEEKNGNILCRSGTTGCARDLIEGYSMYHMGARPALKENGIDSIHDHPTLLESS